MQPQPATHVSQNQSYSLTHLTFSAAGTNWTVFDPIDRADKINAAISKLNNKPGQSPVLSDSAISLFNLSISEASSTRKQLDLNFGESTATYLKGRLNDKQYMEVIRQLYAEENKRVTEIFSRLHSDPLDNSSRMSIVQDYLKSCSAQNIRDDMLYYWHTTNCSSDFATDVANLAATSASKAANRISHAIEHSAFEPLDSLLRNDPAALLSRAYNMSTFERACFARYFSNEHGYSINTYLLLKARNAADVGKIGSYFDFSSR